MKILDFFRKIRKKTEEKLEEQQSTKQANLEELDLLINDKKKQNQEESYIFKKNIKDRVSKLLEELEEHIPKLEKIDLDDKKVQEKIKLVVKENINQYIIYLNRLINNLIKIIEKDEKIIKIIDEINFTLNDFAKKSSISFEKSTFLVGKELELVRKSIANFLTDFRKQVNENKKILDFLKTISIIETNIKGINNIKEINLKNKENIRNIDEKLKGLIDKREEIKKEIKNIKESEEYKKEVEEKKDIEDIENEISLQIYDLKQLIDFKKLANAFHSNEKDMLTIKNYKDNFLLSFKKTNGEDIIDLANSLDNDVGERLADEAKEIKERYEKIDKNIKNQEHEKIKQSEKNIEKIDSEMEEFNIEKVKEERRNDKLKINKEDLIETLRLSLEKIKIELISN